MQGNTKIYTFIAFPIPFFVPSGKITSSGDLHRKSSMTEMRTTINTWQEMTFTHITHTQTQKGLKYQQMSDTSRYVHKSNKLIL